jgi:centrosomal protein CEP104
LAFLSHQNKICTRIDIEGKEDQDEAWTRMGYTTLESGVTTNYQSRELRNVNLGGRVILLMKFTFHQNYTNHINIFNQIGLIALLVYGEKATVERNLLKGKEGTVLASLSDLDKETIMKLKNLEQLKREAIEEQRFDDAKQIKEDIDSLQNNLKAIIVLEKSKKEAIKREDYD